MAGHAGLGPPGDTCGAERAVIGVAGGVEGIGPGPARWQVRAGCAVIGGPGGGAGRGGAGPAPGRAAAKAAQSRRPEGANGPEPRGAPRMDKLKTVLSGQDSEDRGGLSEVSGFRRGPGSTEPRGR